MVFLCFNLLWWFPFDKDIFLLLRLWRFVIPVHWWIGERGGGAIGRSITWIIPPAYSTTAPPQGSLQHREIQPSTVHRTEYLFKGFPRRRNLCIGWNSKEMATSPLEKSSLAWNSFRKNFSPARTFKKGGSAGFPEAGLKKNFDSPISRVEMGERKNFQITARVVKYMLQQDFYFGSDYVYYDGLFSFKRHVKIGRASNIRAVFQC